MSFDKISSTPSLRLMHGYLLNFGERRSQPGYGRCSDKTAREKAGLICASPAPRVACHIEDASTDA